MQRTASIVAQLATITKGWIMLNDTQTFVNNKHRVVIKKDKSSENEIHEDLEYEEMLSYFADRKSCYLFKIYVSVDGSIWKLKMEYANGELLGSDHKSKAVNYVDLQSITDNTDPNYNLMDDIMKTFYRMFYGIQYFK